MYSTDSRHQLRIDSINKEEEEKDIVGEDERMKRFQAAADLLTRRGLLLHWLLLAPSSLSRDDSDVSLRGAQQLGSFSLLKGPRCDSNQSLFKII